MKRLFSVLFILTISSVLCAQRVSIKGMAKPFNNKEINVYTSRNYLNNSLTLLANTTIEENGNFELDFDCKKISYITLKVDNYFANMYVQPLQEYEIILQAPDSTTYQNRNIEHSIKISINLKSKTEINALTMDFDKRFDDFLSTDYKSFVSRTPQAKIDSFRIAMKEYYSTVNNSFFSDYIKYSIATLEEKTKNDPKKIYYLYLKNKPVLYDHPEYMNLFNAFYKQKLETIALSKNGTGLPFIINEKANFSSASEYLKKDYYLFNDTLRELVLIKGLYESYYTNSFKKNCIKSMLVQAATESKIKEHKSIAKDILQAFSSLQVGSIAPPFELPDKTGLTHSLDEFRNKKYVYLTFFEPNNTASLQQLKTITALKKKYGDKINFVSVCSLQSNEELSTFIKSYPAFDWYILYDNSINHLLRTSYEVRSIPSYYFISPDGKFIQVPADSPEENIDRVFFDATKGKRKTSGVGEKQNPKN
jgi:peroxiredoxin